MMCCFCFILPVCCEPDSNLVDQVCSQFKKTRLAIKTPYSNDEAPDAEYSNENDSEGVKTNTTSAIPNFINP